jgi:hypothetical protein
MVVTGIKAMHCQGDWQDFKMFFKATHPWSLFVPVHGLFWLDDRTLSRAMVLVGAYTSAILVGRQDSQ